MARIFISYRREDSDIWVSRLVDELHKHFPPEQVFQDIASINPGADFKETLNDALATAAVMLAVIGRGWLSATDKQGRRRLDLPADFVRQEIAESLRRPGVRVFPLLVNGAEMPTEEDLPDPLKALHFRHALDLTVKHWHQDVAQLVQTLKRVEAEEEAKHREAEERAAKEESARKAAEEQARKEADEEARRKADEEARRKAEEETKRREAEEHAAREEAARIAAEEQAKKKADVEARGKAEEARRAAEAEAQRKAAEEARRRAEEETKRREAEERAAKEQAQRAVAAEQAKRKAGEEARQKAEEDESRRKVAEEARRKAEQQEAQRKAAEEARREAEEEQAKKAAEQARRAPADTVVAQPSNLGWKPVAGIGALVGVVALVVFFSRSERPEPSPAPALEAKRAAPAVEKTEPPPSAVASFKPGETFRDCDQCPQMVVIPAGAFTMGSPESEKGRSQDEGPQHKVTIARPFAVGKHEVTFEEWDTCVAAGGCKTKPEDQGWGRGRQPVINVSWDDAQQYVAWLSKKTGKNYRLLSEAQWEYAARAGTTTRYPWGDEPGTNRANFDKSGSKWSGKQTAPVGGFDPNKFGLYDMIGNVWEWVQDCWNDSYKGAPGDGTAWESGNCGLRVLRGGSWKDAPGNARVALRFRIEPGLRLSGIGFRVARTL